MGSWKLWGCVVAVALVGSACREKRFTEPFKLADKVGEDGNALAGTGASLDPKLLNDGHDAYMHYCYGCHGRDGDGQGPAAYTMRPPPRNFQHGMFKFAGVPAGQLPTDDALDRTIRRGLHGTPMLPWDIPDMERKAIIAYLKTFKLPGAEKSPWQESPAGEPIPVAADPWGGNEAEAVKRGEEAYHIDTLAGCAGCHPAYATREALTEMSTRLKGAPSEFREELYRSDRRETQYAVRLDEKGEMAQAHQILPPDFLFHKVKSAYPVGTKVHEGNHRYVEYTAAMQREDLYRTIAAGINGALMPTWLGAGTLTEKDLWALAYYVQSLVAKQGTAEGLALRARLEAQAAAQPPPAAPAPPTPGGETQGGR